MPYFHVVFTLPPEAAEIAFQNKALVYALLMRSAAEAPMRLAEDPKRLGAEIGLLAVLHTWGQTLTHHPHVHCVVPGGGLSLDGQRWIACRPGFFLPVQPFAAVPALVSRRPGDAFEDGALRFFSDLAPLAEPRVFAKLSGRCARPIGSSTPSRPLAARSRFSPISRATPIASRSPTPGSSRSTDEEVAFSYKDYRRNGRQRIMRLAADEFIRRFLLHVLPDGFHRIRHYGFLARGDRRERIELCRKLASANQTTEPEPPACEEPPAAQTCVARQCPDCGAFMRRIGVASPISRSPFFCDTS